MTERNQNTEPEGMTWEELVADSEADRKAAAVQTKLTERIVFPYKGGTYSEFVQSLMARAEGEKIRRFQVKISNLEVILPFLWEKEGWIKEPKRREPGPSEQATKATIIGNTLHELDALFSVVAQNSGGMFLGDVMPTVRDK